MGIISLKTENVEAAVVIKGIMKSSVTDWIQALAVTIGVVFALREFILHDRVEERSKKEAVFQLIISGQNESISKSAQSIQRVFYELMKKEQVATKDWVHLQTIYFPIQAHLSAWGFCYNHNMCNRELTEAYICDNLIDFDKFRAIVNKKVNNPNFTRGKSYQTLLNVCLAKK